MKELDRKRNDTWRSYDQASRDVEDKKNHQLDQIETQLEQQVSTEILFTVHWSIV